MIRVINIDKLISILSKELAYLQWSADYWYYINHDQEMSSYELDKITELKNIANDLKILDEVWDSALEIYDFTNSGKRSFKPNIKYIDDFKSFFEDHHKSRLIF